MRLNVRKRNGVWAVAVDEAVLAWFPGVFGWWEAIADCRNRVEHPILTEYELGLR